MRKQDIKPGVVYAYQEGKYGATLPAMLLTTDLYKGRDDYRDTESLKFRKAGAADTPHAGRLGSPTTGYLIAIARHQISRRVDYDEVAERIAKITLADMEATGGESPAGEPFGYMLIVRLGVIIGPWDEVMAERREHDAAKKRRQEQEAAQAKALDDRAAAVRLVLITNGISPRFSGTDRNLIVSLDDAEKLAALLAMPSET